MTSIAAKILAVGVIICLPTILASDPSLADTRYVSKDGNLIVQYGNKCSTVKPSGSYRVRNGVSGELTALDCSSVGGDIAEHKFMDTAGKERCYGRMTQVWAIQRNPRESRIVTSWEIQGAVSGYPCSQVGRKFEIDMDGGKQI